MKKWKRCCRKEKNERRKEILRKKIEAAETQIIVSKEKERKTLEEKTLENIKKEPKMLYSFVKRMNKKQTEIGPLKKDGELIYDKKKISNILASKYEQEFTARIDNEYSEDEILMENEEYLTDIIISEDDIKRVIKEIRDGAAAGPDGVPALLLKKTAETMSKPLAIMLRKSVDNGEIYEEHKLAYITPIFKNGSRMEAGNYRPVSLTSHIIKIYERVIKKHIMVHLSDNELFNKGQHGFVPNRSTMTQLMVHHESIYENMLENKSTEVVYLDFAKAFDKVDHNILIRKVMEHKISGKIIRWIREFLKNRKQIVIANGVKSDETEVISGVPQGTVLAALLFVIMIYDIDKDITNTQVRSFADDTRVSRSIVSQQDREIMQSDLNKIYKWAEDNRMMFNANKFEQMNYGKTEGEEYEYRGPSQERIVKKSEVKDLGVVINNMITCSDQINVVISKCRAKIGMIFRHFNTRNAEHMLMLYKTYIRSQIEYCNIVWYPHYQKDIAKIESIQRSYTARIEGMEDMNYWERLKKLNLYSLERRRERYMIIQAWKQIEGLSENIMKLKLSGRSTRGRIIIPRTIPGRLSKANRTIIHHSPAAIMQRLFNTMPLHIRDLTGVSLITFKKKLDKFLKDVPDNPRLEETRYIRRCSTVTNSLVDQCRGL